MTKQVTDEQVVQADDGLVERLRIGANIADVEETRYGNLLRQAANQIERLQAARIAHTPPAAEDEWRNYTSAPLSFDGGTISISRDGSGYFAVNEREADWETDDESGSTCIVAKFSAGEAQEIRDHLNKYFPPAAVLSTLRLPTGSGEVVEAFLETREFLGLLEQAVCDWSCPTQWRTEDGQPHSKLHEDLKAVLFKHEAVRNAVLAALQSRAVSLDGVGE